MKTARKFLVLTVLLAVLIILFFKMPSQFELVKDAVGVCGLIVLILFMSSVWKWRKSLSPEDMKEIEH